MRLTKLLSLLALFAFIAISPCFADYFEQSWEAAATARRDLTSISNLDDLKRAIENNAQAVEVDLYDRNWRKTDILTEADLEGLAKLPHLKKLTFMPLFESVRTSKYLRHLKHLEVLTCPIGGDEATAAIPLSAPLRSLTVYGITNKSLPRIGHFKNLEILSVQGDITDEGLKSLESLTHLKELFLGSQSITGEGLKYFSKNKDLKKLEWSSSIRLGDAAMSSLKFFPNLRILNIRNSSVTDAGFANVAQLKNLEMLECGFTEVTDHGMKALSGLDKLSSVSLQGMNVTDEGMRYLSTVPNLQMLSLSELGITDQSIEYLSRLPKLSRLSFWEVNISDKALPWFRKMPALKSLEVKFSRAPNSELQRFSQSIKPKLPSTHKAQIVTKPLVADGCVLFRLENGAFICLDANSGKELWRRQGYWNSSFRVVGNTLFRYSGGNPSATVTAIQPRSGVEIWNYAIKSVDKDLSLSAYAKLVTDSSNAYVVRHDGRVICLDQKNGNCKWDNRLPNIIRCWFVYQDARFIYLQTTLREDEDDEQESVPTKVMAVSKDTGSIAWTAKPMYDSKDEICFCSCPEFDCIFLVSPSAKVDVLDRSTGNVLCNRDLLHYAFSSSESDEASVLFDDHGLSLFYIAKTSAETYQLASYGLVRKNGKVELFEGIKSKPIFRPESQRLHKDTIPKLQALRRNIIIITSDKKLICLDTKTRRRVQRLELPEGKLLAGVLTYDLGGKNVAVVGEVPSGNSFPSTFNTTLTAFGLATGRTIWSLSTEGTFRDLFRNEAPFAFDSEHKLFYVECENGLICQNLATNKLNWEWETELTENAPICGGSGGGLYFEGARYIAPRVGYFNLALLQVRLDSTNEIGGDKQKKLTQETMMQCLTPAVQGVAKARNLDLVFERSGLFMGDYGDYMISRRGEDITDAVWKELQIMAPSDSQIH